jgi:hypothetical protein
MDQDVWQNVPGFSDVPVLLLLCTVIHFLPAYPTLLLYQMPTHAEATL